MRLFSRHLIIALLSVLVIACSSNDGSNTNDSSKQQLNIVATTGMIADMVSVIGGDNVIVKGLMGPGVDPHLYKASAGDVALLSKADVIFYNGLHLEGKMTEIFEQMKSRGIETVAVSDGVDRSDLLTPPEFKGNHDPHIWFDVTLWMNAVGPVRNILIEKDPENAPVYNENADSYLAALSELNEYVKERANSLPEDKRVLITAHDAFNYFGRGYGFEVRGLQGISTASEAGTADVQELATIIVERRIPAVFVESSVPPRYIEAVQAAVKSKGFNVKIGGELFSDAMGNPGTPEGNYIGMVRHNINTIVDALGQGGES
ncbi:MAG: manganese transporter [Thermodesulfobacteriales bacterium]|nr:MAG: manganese transporter [Thermodesulfobacteriales bacterium]